MPKFRPYHFIQCQSTDFLPFYQAIVAADGIVCFDFEDSIGGNSSDAQTIVALKQRQRQRVGRLLGSTPGLDFDRLVIRINAPNTAHYAADLAALRELPALHAVFVPKVERPDTLRQVLHELPLPVRHVIAVIETNAAFANLPALLALPDPRLGLVAFGHCDYNLSCGHFPFFHHDAPEYWSWLAALDEQLQAADKQLLNSPVLRLADATHFQAVLRQLRCYPSATGQVTLCLAHTQACAVAPASPAIASDAYCPDKAVLLAWHFEQGQQPGRNFAIDAGRRLISPHEYSAARRLVAQAL